MLHEKAHKYDKFVESYREATHKTPCVYLCGCIIATARQGAHRNLCLTKAEYAQLKPRTDKRKCSKLYKFQLRNVIMQEVSV